MTRLTLPRFGTTDWTTVATVIATDLGVTYDAVYQTTGDQVHVDLSAAPRGRALEVCDFYLAAHPEIRWSVQ